ncbi:putative transmembrane reductase [Pseudolycoriella hygida]|uniref:ascorbate ferrireductase (transmembrane) n=1 Tax=Pseudolycoriella hygida TaxID=35572 RepID=A0A9Q0RXT2_9DIPT|nr:putative transmembrane reductase [Pseudolycoriella hygida]
MSSLNTVRHLVILLLIVFVAYCSFSDGFSLFAFHPPLMLTGFLLLMTEAVMVFSNDRAFNQKITGKNRLDLHGTLQFGAGICILLGFLSIKYSKAESNDEEEPSFHSNVGYTACLLTAGAFGGGTLARYGGLLKLPVKVIQIFHAIFGSFAYYLALNAICSGLNSTWLLTIVSQNTIYGLMGVVIIIGIRTLYAPIFGVYGRVKRLFSKDKQ